MTLSNEQKREIARRLENWGRWHWGGNSMSASGARSPFPAYNLVNIDSARAENRNIPVLMGEGEDTDRILRSMHSEFVKVLIVHHLSRATPRDRARRCKVRSIRTYYRRVARAEEIFNGLCFPRRHSQELDTNSGRFAKVAITR
jgi:hypothetical protein